MARRESSMGWKPQTGSAAKKEVGEVYGSVSYKENISGLEQKETVFCVRYSGDGKYAAACYGNGAVRIFETATWTPVQRLRSLSHNSEGQAATCMRWRPHCPTKSFDIMVGCASGVIQQWGWEPDTSSDAEYCGSIIEHGNEVMCLDYSPDGNLMVTCGSDRLVRLYDTMSSKLQQELQHGLDDRGYVRQAHSSRVFSCRFLNQHTVVSGGWESPCQIWDLRTGKSEKQLLGTHICADSLTVSPNTSTVIVASYRHKNQLMIFDYLTGRDCTPDGLNSQIGTSAFYSTSLGPDQTTLHCVGSKPNTLCLVDIRTGEKLGGIEEYVKFFFFFFFC